MKKRDNKNKRNKDPPPVTFLSTEKTEYVGQIPQDWFNKVEKMYPQLTTALRIRPSVFMGEDQFLEGVLLSSELNGIMGGTDQVLSSMTDQAAVFDSLIVPQLQAFLQGNDTSLVVCGLPGSGKSYTLFGAREADYGILPRTASFLFFHVEQQESVPEHNWLFKKITISVFEVFSNGVRDLLNPDGTGPYQLHMTERALVTVKGLTVAELSSAGEMMSHLQSALNTRASQQSTASVFIQLHLSQILPDGTKLMSQAQFCEMFAGEVKLPYPIQLDFLIFQTLPELFTPVFNYDVQCLHNLDIFVLLKDSFTGKFGHTTVLCCVAPSALMMDKTINYLRALMSSLAIVKVHLTNIMLDMKSRQALENNSSYDSSDEDRCLGNTAEGQESASHLECIEEVTESEEDIASSDEEMSQSDQDLYESSSDSDHDGTGNYSDSDFQNNLNSMCEQFNNFVDSFVDNFKNQSTRTIQTQTKVNCSSTRRGGLPWMQNWSMEERPLQTKQPAKEPLQLHLQHAGKVQPCPVSDGEKSVPSVKAVDLNSRSGLTVLEPKKKSDLFIERPALKDSTDIYKKETKKSSETSVKLSLSKSSTDVSKAGEINEDVEQRLRAEQAAIGRLQRIWAHHTNSLSAHDVSTMSGYRTLQIEQLLNLCSVLTDNRKVLEGLINSFDDIRSPSEMENIVTKKIRELRSNCQVFVSMRNTLNSQITDSITEDQNTSRDYLIADLMVETFDLTIDHWNRQLLGSQEQPEVLPSSSVGKLVAANLSQFSSQELYNLLLHFFIKIVDLRESGRSQDESVKELLVQLDKAELRISHMHKKLQETRNYKHNHQKIVEYPVSLPTKHLALPPPVSAIPQQNLNKLQPKPGPSTSTKVTMKQRKIIIEQKRDK